MKQGQGQAEAGSRHEGDLTGCVLLISGGVWADTETYQNIIEYSPLSSTTNQIKQITRIYLLYYVQYTYNNRYLLFSMFHFFQRNMSRGIFNKLIKLFMVRFKMVTYVETFHYVNKDSWI